MGFFQDAWRSQFQKINKVKGEPDNQETSEGALSEPVDELTLSMTDEELADLGNRYEELWKKSKYRSEWEAKCQKNEEYWLGNQDKVTGERKLQDNVIFESTETLLPAVGRTNPEPVVACDDSEEGEALASTTKKMLVYHAADLSLKSKGKMALRHWAIYYVGVAKMGWSMEKNDIDMAIVRPSQLILDPDAIIEDGVYYGSFIGQYLNDTADTLKIRFPKVSDEIDKASQDKGFSKLGYAEIWTNEYVFWKMGRTILGKSKNPHWNYGGMEKRVNEIGEEIEEEVQGNNHFPSPRQPFVFLTVFNLGLHPFDDTSLIEQNISKQDLINKRLRQIDRNADRMNNGMILDGRAFNDEQATDAANALARGSAIRVPNGDVNAVKRLDMSALPTFIYDQVQDCRSAIRSSFGVLGMAPQGIMNEQTVRGKIIVQGQDQSRLALITEAMEHFYANIFDWFIQLYHVYYEEQHTASIVGDASAREYIGLSANDFTKKVRVSVKDGSLIPKDDMTKRNEAVDLWAANAIDPISLYAALGYPDPKKQAEQLNLWQMDRNTYFGLPPAPVMPAEQGGMPPEAAPVQEPAPAPLDQIPTNPLPV